MGQYFTDFSEYSIAAGVPTGFTRRAGDHTVAIVDESARAELSGELTGNRALSVDAVTHTDAANILSFDAAGTPSQFDVIVRMIPDAYINEVAGVAVRAAASTATHAWSLYMLGADQVRVREAGTATSLTHGLGDAGSLDDLTPVFVRVRANGTNFAVTADTDLGQITGATPLRGWIRDVADPDTTATGYIGALTKSDLVRTYFDWIGIGTDGDPAPTSSVSGETLAVPTNFTFAAASGLRQLDGSWTAVSGADTYDWEVERSDSGAWVAFQNGNTASTSFQLTDADNVDWGKTYRGRVRSVPSA